MNPACAMYQGKASNAQPVVIVSQHAYVRAEQRLQWGRQETLNRARRAFSRGRRREEYAGRFRDWLNGGERPGDIRVHGHVVFIFQCATVVTLYEVPENLRPFMGERHEVAHE